METKLATRISDILNSREIITTLASVPDTISRKITIELVRPVEITECDSVFDTVSKDFDVKSIKPAPPLKTTTKYRIESLNGIHRLTDLKTKYEYIYEETSFVISDRSNILILIIKTPCASELIPTIVDYDEQYEYTESVYSVGQKLLRKIQTDTYTQHEFVSILNSNDLQNIDHILESVRCLGVP